MPKRVLSGYVKLMVMVSVLDGPDPTASARQLPDQLDDERRLPGIFSTHYMQFPHLDSLAIGLKGERLETGHRFVTHTARIL